jgi:hypothetical protein
MVDSESPFTISCVIIVCLTGIAFHTNIIAVLASLNKKGEACESRKPAKPRFVARNQPISFTIPVLPVLFCLSHSACSTMPVPLYLACSACPVLRVPFVMAVMSWQSCFAILVLIERLWLFCPACNLLPALFRLSVLHVLFCLSWSACPVLPIPICLSYSACPTLPVLFCLFCLSCSENTFKSMSMSTSIFASSSTSKSTSTFSSC